MAPLIVAIFLFIVYTFLAIRWEKLVSWRLNESASRMIKYIHYATLLVVLFVAFTYLQYSLVLRGLWTTRLLIIVAVITGVVMWFVTNRAAINRLELIYFRFFTFLPTVTGAFLCVPFLGVMIVFSFAGRLFEPTYKIYYDDDHIRIQRSFKGLMAPPRLEITTKQSIFEKLAFSEEDFYDFDSAAVQHDADSTRIIMYKQDVDPRKLSLISPLK